MLSVLSIAQLMKLFKAEYPTKPVTLMVGYPADGSTDMYTRAFTSFAHEHLGYASGRGQASWVMLVKRIP